MTAMSEFAETCALLGLLCSVVNVMAPVEFFREVVRTRGKSLENARDHTVILMPYLLLLMAAWCWGEACILDVHTKESLLAESRNQGVLTEGQELLVGVPKKHKFATLQVLAHGFTALDQGR